MNASGFDKLSTSSAQMPMHRSSFQHYSQQNHHQHGHRCRCSECHIKTELFPRNDQGTILLPHPSWIKPLGPVNESLFLENRRWSGQLPSLDNKKGKGMARTASLGQSTSGLEGPGQPRSPSWRNRLVAPIASTFSPSTSANSKKQHRPDYSFKLPQILPSPAIAGSSQARQQLPHFSDLHAPPSTSYHGLTSPASKRKASELQGQIPYHPSSSTEAADDFLPQEPTQHVLNLTFPLPPSVGNGTPPVDASKRSVRRRTHREDNESTRGTIEPLGLPYQPYHHHVSGGPPPRSHLGKETVFSHEFGPSRSGSSPLSETDRASPSVPPLGPGLSAPIDGSRFVFPAQPPSGIATSEPSLIGFSVRPENHQPQGVITTARMTQTRGESADMSLADDTSSALGEGEDVDGDRDSGSENSEQNQQGGSQKCPQANSIRFREPLTSKSRQDRKVFKGGVAIVQVKWDSDRKRRQGYFAPDNGAEKSRFRHYSKDDCCFDD